VKIINFYELLRKYPAECELIRSTLKHESELEQINHPNIVKLYKAFEFEADKCFYYLLELCTTSLKDYLDNLNNNHYELTIDEIKNIGF